MLRRPGALLLACLVAVGCHGPATPSPASGPPPSLTLASYDKIRPGMTLAEVEAILGPAGATSRADVKRPDGSTVREVRSASWAWFLATAPAGGGEPRQEERRITVRLQDGRVASKEQVGLP